MNIFADFTQHVREAVVSLGSAGVTVPEAALDRIIVEAPRDASHGDLATNAAMVLAKEAGMKPRDLAEKIAGRLGGLDSVSRVDVAGPGFINLALKPSIWPKVLEAAVLAGRGYGRGALGGGRPVNIE